MLKKGYTRGRTPSTRSALSSQVTHCEAWTVDLSTLVGSISRHCVASLVVLRSSEGFRDTHDRRICSCLLVQATHHESLLLKCSDQASSFILNTRGDEICTALMTHLNESGAGWTCWWCRWCRWCVVPCTRFWICNTDRRRLCRKHHCWVASFQEERDPERRAEVWDAVNANARSEIKYDFIVMWMWVDWRCKLVVFELWAITEETEEKTCAEMLGSPLIRGTEQSFCYMDVCELFCCVWCNAQYLLDREHKVQVQSWWAWYCTHIYRYVWFGLPKTTTVWHRYWKKNYR